MTLLDGAAKEVEPSTLERDGLYLAEGGRKHTRPSFASKCGVGLRPYTPADSSALYGWRTDPSELFLWHTNRWLVSPEKFQVEMKALEERFLDYAVISDRSPAPVGLIYADKPAPNRTSARLGIYVAAEARGGYVGAVAFFMFVQALFFNHPIEKIAFGAARCNGPSTKLIEKFATPDGDGKAYFVSEGIMRKEFYVDGESHDYESWALTRQSFYRMQADNRLVRRLVG